MRIEDARSRGGIDGAYVDKERRRLVQDLLAGPLGLRFRERGAVVLRPDGSDGFRRAHGRTGHRVRLHGPAQPVQRVRRRNSCAASANSSNIADVVFAGGPKIGRDKIKYNVNTHSYGCGVDVKHFGTARQARARRFPPDVASLYRARCSAFFGVVDERMDYELVAAAGRRDIRRATSSSSAP